MRLIDRAYATGVCDAKISMSLESGGDKLTPLLGGVPVVGPGLAAVTSGVTAPKRDSGLASGLVTGGSSLVGGLGGSVLGGLAGIPLGLLLHKYFPASYHLPTDPYLELETLKDLISKVTRVGQGAAGGAALGGILGSAGGAHLGRQAMKSKDRE